MEHHHGGLECTPGNLHTSQSYRADLHTLVPGWIYPRLAENAPDLRGLLRQLNGVVSGSDRGDISTLGNEPVCPGIIPHLHTDGQMGTKTLGQPPDHLHFLDRFAVHVRPICGLGLGRLTYKFYDPLLSEFGIIAIMTSPTQPSKYFRRHIALPSDHGSWVFLLSPMLIGFFASGRWTSASGYLILGSLAAFFLRQPTSMAVKAYAGRRSRQDLPAARLWMMVYGLIELFALSNLFRLGYDYLVFLAIPGLLVFAWYLWLISKRSERGQIGVDVIASGSLALAAPAALWVGLGEADPLGWWLWGLTWLQSGASIVYAFLRLEQRNLKEMPDTKMKFKLARRALLYSSFNFVAVLILSLTKMYPAFLWIPYALQWLEVLWGTFKPAVGYKPTQIGFRQLGVSTLFTVLFIVIWG